MSLFILNEGPTLRLSPALAQEVGLVQSILLLQLDYLCETKGKTHPGHPGKWVKMSYRAFTRNCVPFWSVATVSRAFAAMSEEGLVELLFLGENIKPNSIPNIRIGPACESLSSVRMDIPSKAPEKKKSKKKEVSKDTATENGIYQLAIALAKVCNMDFDMNKGRMLREAKPLLGRTVEQLEQLFGAGGAWYRMDFRGKIGSPPTPGQVKSEWLKMSMSAGGSRPAEKVMASDGGMHV